MPIGLSTLAQPLRSKLYQVTIGPLPTRDYAYLRQPTPNAMLGCFGSDPKPYKRSSLTDTKTAEYFPKQIIARDLPRNFTERNLGSL